MEFIETNKMDREAWLVFAAKKAEGVELGKELVGFVSGDLGVFDAQGATPRDWTRALAALKTASEAGRPGDAIAAMPALLPGEVGARLGAYLSVVHDARASARELIEGAEPQEGIESRIKARIGGGMSADQRFFSYQFGAGLAENAARAVVGDEASAGRALRGFVMGACHLTEDVRAFALDHLASLVSKGAGPEARERAGGALAAEARALSGGRDIAGKRAIASLVSGVETAFGDQAPIGRRRPKPEA